MSNPSFSNIDMWLFELAEGNLSPEQVEQLELFLLNNPDVDVDRDVWEMAKVEKQAIAYPNVADLERKRRPIVAFAFAGLLLLLIGSGSYIAFNGQTTDQFTEADLIAQNEQVKAELQNQLRISNNQVNAQNLNADLSQNSWLEKLSQGETNGATLIAANGANSEASNVELNGIEVATTNRNGILVNSESNQNFTAAEFGTTPQIIPFVALPSVATPSLTGSSANLETEFANPSVTNLDNLGYVDELNEGLGNSDNVGSKDFSVRQASEIDVYEGRVWNERKASTSVQSSSSSGGSKRRVFKERLSKFSRSLERMMNSPIALKNSRDPHYHVPGMTSSDINFSSAGTLVATRVQATSRLQWHGKANEQLMNQVSIDGYSKEIVGGWGIQLNHQWYKDGGIQVAQAAFTYSPKISVSNWVSVEPSFRFKMGNKRLDANQMLGTDVVEMDRGNARDFYANGETPIGQSLWYKDLGVGLLVNTKWFFAGVQADNLFKHKDNLYTSNWSDPRRAENHFTATIGSDWVSRNERTSLSPYVVYQKSEDLSEVWAGANFAADWFNVGLAVSSNLEPAASIGMKFDHFSLHYNADYTQSKMLGEKAFSHQLTLRFVAKQNTFGKQLFNR